MSDTLSMWDVQYTVAPKEPHRYRMNKRLHVVTTGIERAIELAKTQGEDVQISQILKRSAGDLLIDPEAVDVRQG